MRVVQHLALRALAALLSTAAATSFAQSVSVVEYRNKTLDAYFITGRVSEQAALDTTADFDRTGMTFQANAVVSAPSSFTSICRFYISLTVPFTRSHFYGRQGNECEGIVAMNLLGFSYEGFDFAIVRPSANGCPPNTVPIYRGFRAAANGKTPNRSS